MTHVVTLIPGDGVGWEITEAGERETAGRIRAAVGGALRDDGIRTRDLGGHATTRELTVAVVRRLA